MNLTDNQIKNTKNYPLLSEAQVQANVHVHWEGRGEK